jgi:hypothetical protein
MKPWRRFSPQILVYDGDNQRVPGAEGGNFFRDLLPDPRIGSIEQKRWRDSEKFVVFLDVRNGDWVRLVNVHKMIGSDTISLLNPLPAPRYLRSASFTLSLKRVPLLDWNHPRKFAEESSKPASPNFVFIKKIGTMGKLLPGEHPRQKECAC